MQLTGAEITIRCLEEEGVVRARHEQDLPDLESHARTLPARD